MTAVCGCCGRPFDPAVDHQGRRGAPPRRYCRPDCTREARLGRRRDARAQAAHRRHLQAVYGEELSGRQPALPAMPPVPVAG